MGKILSLLVIGGSLFLSGCGLENIKPENNICKENKEEFVEGGDGCMYYETIIPQTSEKKDVLVVWLRGDKVGKREVDPDIYSYSLSHAITKKAVVVSLYRPGYCESSGQKCSTGYYHGGYAAYTNIDVRRLQNAITNLKKHFNVKKLIIAGHSSGGALASLIASKIYVDGIVVSGCACSFYSWINHHGYSSKYNFGLDPYNNISNIGSGTKIRIIAGKNDKNSLPKFSVSYFQKAERLGRDVKIFITNDNHRDLISSQKIYDEISAML